MPVETILRGLKRFQNRVFPKHRELFHKLALGQRPDALFITCADSRIDPCLLTQTKPGELFICRVIGNVVPRYPRTIGGVSATIEYAVGVLGVSDIIVCGHTDCGVMKGVLNPAALKPLTSVTAVAAPRACCAARSESFQRGPAKFPVPDHAHRMQRRRAAQESAHASGGRDAPAARRFAAARVGLSHRKRNGDRLRCQAESIYSHPRVETAQGQDSSCQPESC